MIIETFFIVFIARVSAEEAISVGHSIALNEHKGIQNIRLSRGAGLLESEHPYKGNYAAPRIQTWPVSTKCTKIFLFFEKFVTEKPHDWVEIIGPDGETFRKITGIRKRPIKVPFSSFKLKLKTDMSEERFGFKIKWRCGRIKLEPCCKQIKMYSSYEEGGIYVKNGTVNGHDLFIGAEPENREFGLWYKEDTYGPDWVRGSLQDLTDGWFGYGYQMSNAYETCPELVKEWAEMLGGTWNNHSEKVRVVCDDL